MKLEVCEHKTLALSKVLIETHLNIDFSEIETCARTFETRLKVLNVQTFGPLVTKMSGTHVDNEGALSLDYSVMIQAHDYSQYKHRFICSRSLVVEECLYLQFSGDPDSINMATAALDLFMYEHDIIDSGLVYMILLKSTENHVIVDYFKPVGLYETVS